MKNPLARLGLIAALGTVVLAGACGSPGGGKTTAGGLDSVSVGVVPIVAAAPVYVGEAEGIFTKHGIDLKIDGAQGGAGIVPGVLSGQLQFGYSNVTSLMLANERGLGLQIVTAGTSANRKAPDFSALMVTNDSPIQSARDLEGATVAVNQLKNTGDTTTRAAIAKAGGDPSKVNFVELAFPDMPAALAKGRVDAAWMVEPFVTIGTAQDARVISYNLLDTAPDLMIASYFTSSRLIKSDPELVDRFTAAMNESLEFSTAHPEVVRRVAQGYTKIDKALTEKMTLPAFPTQINRESTRKLGELALKDGTLSKPVDLDALLPKSNG